MSYEDIRFEADDGIAVITLHRPDDLNTFSGKMGVEWASWPSWSDALRVGPRA